MADTVTALEEGATIDDSSPRDDRPRAPGPRPLAATANHTLVVLGLVSLFLVVAVLAFSALQILALAFVGVLVSVLLATPAHALHDRTGSPYWLALLVVVVVLVALVLGFSWFLGERVVEQVGGFVDDLPRLLGQVEERLLGMPAGPWLVEQVDRVEPAALLGGGTEVVAGITGMAMGVFEGVLGVVFVLFIGLFVAASPRRYRDGIIQLVPNRGERRAGQVLGYLTTTLQFWVVGQIAAMVIVGTLTTAGLLIIGIPYAFLLGVIAGLLEFIPIIGPLIAFIPAGLVALTVGTDTLLWVVGLYFVIQQLESYLILPLVQRKAVDLPPALIILVVYVGSQVMGILGMFIAVPITAMVVVLVKTLYVHDVQDDEVELPGGVIES